MAYFPLFLNLTGAKVLLLGEGKVMQEKLNVLLSFGADIRLFSGAAEYSAFTEADLEPRPALVVVADVPRGEKVRISGLCRARGIPVNVVDTPELCSFYFPALITRGDLTVAVSTGGKSPGGAAWLRRHLETHIPDQTEAILEWADGFRNRLRQDHPEADRKRILREAIHLALSGNRIPEEAELSALIRSCNGSNGKDSPGSF